LPNCGCLTREPIPNETSAIISEFNTRQIYINCGIYRFLTGFPFSFWRTCLPSGRGVQGMR